MYARVCISLYGLSSLDRPNPVFLWTLERDLSWATLPFNGMPSNVLLLNKSEATVALAQHHSGDPVIKQAASGSHFDVPIPSPTPAVLYILVCIDDIMCSEKRLFSQCCFRLKWQTLDS